MVSKRKPELAESGSRKLQLAELEEEAKKLTPKRKFGWVPVPEFAKYHAHRSVRRVYEMINEKVIPAYLVKIVLGHKELDVDGFYEWIARGDAKH
jgi:hypothetical protein